MSVNDRPTRLTTGASTSSLLKGFQLQKILSEDAKSRTACLLGSFNDDKDGERAIILLEKTQFSQSFYENIGRQDDEDDDKSIIAKLTLLGSNDIYTWALGWISECSKDAHIKCTIIRPASEAHILKYTEQSKIMITETPELYRSIVKPWITKSQSIERNQWVYNILEKKKESETILFEQENSFIILPDLKWDGKTLTSLYLIAIVHDRSLRTMRDLNASHVTLLQSIKREAQKVVSQIVNNNNNIQLRFFIHYQPTYYHFHVHILHANFTSHPGAIVGQAHLLDDVIDLLQLGIDFEKRTLTYALGEQSPLLDVIRKSSI